MAKPMFQKRHYEAIAQSLQDACDGSKEWGEIVSHLATMFRVDNGQFDRGRFAAACIPGANVKARPKKPKAAKVKPTYPATEYLNAVAK